MDIYIVQLGDTITAIADKFGVTVERLIKDNGLTDTVNLIPGQTIVITYPKQVHTVQEGDTLNRIANMYGITILQLLQYNAFLADREYLYPGESLVISYSTSGALATHGFLYSNISRRILVKTLPLLSYISVFNYGIKEDNEIISYGEDADVVKLALDYGTIPLLMISTITPEGVPNIELIYEILLNKELQNQLIQEIINIIHTKGYYGVNLLVSGINTTNQQLYIDYFDNISSKLKEEGLYLFISINLNVLDNNVYTARDKLDYSAISKSLNGIVFLQYYWGTNPGAPKPVNNISQIESYIEYVITLMEEDKIIVGLTPVGYDWELPYRPDISRVSVLSSDNVILLAQSVNATIQFDYSSQTPFFNYTTLYSGRPIDHIVWFIDARSINSLLELNYQNDILGSGIWGIMVFHQQVWSLIYSRFEIIKYLPFNII